jgi:DNA polymerase I-like protein with 3'-5' exonuclease and polymerase domains
VPGTCTVYRHEPRSRHGGCARPSVAVPILVCPDETVVECDEDEAEKVEALVTKTLIDGMDEVVNELKAEGPPVPIEVEDESGRTWTG